MKTLNLNEMEIIEAGRGSNCSLGIALAGAFVGGAFTLATAGVGSFFVGVGFGLFTHWAEKRLCY